jgi:hypothetical protein
MRKLETDRAGMYAGHPMQKTLIELVLRDRPPFVAAAADRYPSRVKVHRDVAR